MKQADKLAILEGFLWRLNFHRAVSMNEQKVFAMLKMADEWVGAHSSGNGERSTKDVDKNVNAAYEKLKVLP